MRLPPTPFATVTNTVTGDVQHDARSGAAPCGRRQGIEEQ
jgi:hypothetical protein